MDREDLLRELELLPVWRWRAPVGAAMDALVKEGAIEVGTVSQTAANVEAVTATSVQTELSAEKASLFAHISCENKQYLFVFNATQQDDGASLSKNEALLFKNISLAMGIRPLTPVLTQDSLQHIQTLSPQCVILLGESTAQTLLKTTDTLAHLRQKLHSIQGVTMIATYDLNHLLENMSDKAKVWDDLCLAMQVVNNAQ